MKRTVDRWTAAREENEQYEESRKHEGKGKREEGGKEIHSSSLEKPPEVEGKPHWGGSKPYSFLERRWTFSL